MGADSFAFRLCAALIAIPAAVWGIGMFVEDGALPSGKRISTVLAGKDPLVAVAVLRLDWEVSIPIYTQRPVHRFGYNPPAGAQVVAQEERVVSYDSRWVEAAPPLSQSCTMFGETFACQKVGEVIYAFDTFADRPKAITPITATHYTWVETERVVVEVLRSSGHDSLPVDPAVPPLPAGAVVGEPVRRVEALVPMAQPHPSGAEVGQVAIPPELVEGVLRDKVVWKTWEYVHHPDGRRAAPGATRPIAPSGKPAVVGVEG